MSSLLILEPHSEGHHLRYARLISEEAVALGYDVCLATSADSFRHPAHAALRVRCGKSLRTVALPEGGPKPSPENVLDSVKLQIHYRSLFRDCYRELSRKERPDYVFVPYLDYCNYATSLFGSPFDDTPWGGLVITPIFHLSASNLGIPSSRLEQIKKRAFLRLLRNESLRAVYTFDETLIQEVRQSQPEVVNQLRFLPEPAELEGTHSRESARKEFSIPSDAKVILVYGTLDHSKGIDALLAATKEDAFPKEAVILLAGLQDTEASTLLAAPQAQSLRKAGRLYERNRYLYGEDEHAVFQAADVVWVGYRHQYISSGVLIQAAMARLPVIACREGLIAWLTERHGLGLVVGVDNAPAVAKSILQVIRDPDFSTELGENGKRFSASHSVDRFRQRIGEELLLNFPLE